MDDWKTSVLLGWPIFKGYVSFREGICSPRNPNFAPSYPNDSSILSHATGHTARLQDQRCAWNGDLAHQPVATSGRTKAKDPNLATVADDVFRLNGAGAWVFSTERENWAGGFPRTNSAGKPMVSVKIYHEKLFLKMSYLVGWKKKRSRKQIPDNKIGLLHQDQLYSWFSSGCKYPLAKKTVVVRDPFSNAAGWLEEVRNMKRSESIPRYSNQPNLLFHFAQNAALGSLKPNLPPPPPLEDWPQGLGAGGTPS